MQYDATLKELFQNAPQRLIELLTGSTASEVLTPEFSTVQVRRPDLVLRLANGALCHLELQTSNDREMPWRMLEYYVLLARQYGQPPLQQVLYAGPSPLAIAAEIAQPALEFRYRVVDLRELESAPLLESASLEDNLLAILCRIEQPRPAVRRILARISPLPAKAARDALAKLVILSKLRGLLALVNEEQAGMPITISSDILDDPYFSDMVGKRERQAEERGEARGEARGKAHGEAALLRGQLEHKFGPLPEWALKEIEAAGTAQLESWGLRVLDALSLEEVLRR